MSLPPSDSRETRANRPLSSVAAAFDSSEYTRGACQQAADGGANINHHAVAPPPLTVAQKLPRRQDIVYGRQRRPSTIVTL